MDSRNKIQHPFPPPLPQSSVRDPRQAPIPPPPYTLQAPAHRLQPSLNDDPFIPRRNERDESRREQPKPSPHGPYTLGSYATSLSRESLAHPRETRDRPQEASHTAPWMPRVAEGRAERYRHHSAEGEPQPLRLIYFPYSTLRHTERRACRRPQLFWASTSRQSLLCAKVDKICG